MSKLEADVGEPQQRYEPHDVQHSPVVLHQLKKRADDWQLHVADRITAFAGSMPFVWVHVAIFRVLGRVRPLRRRPLSVPVPDVRRVAGSDLPVDVRDDRSEPAIGVPTGKGRPRLPRIGDGAEIEHGADTAGPCTDPGDQRRSAGVEKGGERGLDPHGSGVASSRDQRPRSADGRTDRSAREASHLSARQHGRTSEAATGDAAQYMDGIFGA